jgi:hypothetical protein
VRQVSNYLIDLKRAVIVDVEATTAVPQAEVTAADDRQLAVMLARSAASSMAFEQEAVLFHHPVDALCVDRGLTFGSPLAL